MEVETITKAAIFKSFFHLSYKNTQVTATVLFNIFRRQSLNYYFLGMHKTMNCVFPLRIQKRLIFADVICCSRLRLCVGYFTYLKSTRVFSYLMSLVQLKK